MKKTLLILFMFYALNIVAQHKMYLFLMIQDNAAETGAVQDGKNITSIVKDVCVSANFKLQLVKLSSNKATRDFVQEKLNSFNFSNDDVIWFYYSGHGENYDTYPRTGETELALTDVYNMVKQTGAGLTLSIFDCCCFREPIVNPPKMISIPPKAYKYLFNYAKGHIKISSCSSKEFSYGSENAGSFFTNAFIAALKTEYSWKDILKDAKISTTNMATSYDKVQNPQFKFSSGFKDID